MNLDQLTAAYGEVNARAWLRLIRERESSQEDSAYRVINGGTHFDAPPWRHPWHGIPTTQGARASGAYQFLGTTWAKVADALGFGDGGESFSPINQDLGALFLTAGRGALDDVLGGNVAAACAKCRQEWTSLPCAAEASAGWTMEKAIAVYRHWGGTVADEQQAPPEAATASPQGKAMNPLAILQMLSGILLPMVPQAKNIVQPPLDSSAARNMDLAQLLLQTIVGTVSAHAPATPGLDHPDQLAQLTAAVTAMQKDAALQKKVQAAVVTEPSIMDTLQVTEIGGGIEKAAGRGIAAQADRPFWYNPVVWVTLAMLPIMYLVTYQVLFTLAGPYMVSNGVPNTPLQPNPWYAVVGFDSNTRTGLINLIVGFVFGGVCGIWFGTTVAKRSDATAASDTATTTTK